MEYGLHQSEKLQHIFESQPFPHQGQDPWKSSVVILGLDANYSPGVSDDASFFQNIIDYHKDSVSFWRQNGVHHPFLLPDYPLKKNTGGVPYHRRFAWMQLTPEFAPCISFVELLDRPTTGRTEWKTFWRLYRSEHADQIDRLVMSGRPQLILVSQSLVARYMSHAKKEYSVFPWLPAKFELGPLVTIGETVIFGAPHFSSTTYKKTVFEDLGDTLREFCRQTASASGNS